MVDLVLILKGIAIGTANVIPGVSGGTIALITNIYERLINALKNFNFTAIKLLFKGKIKELIEYIDFYFLLQVFTGVLIALFSVAFLLKYLFALSYLYMGILFWINNRLGLDNNKRFEITKMVGLVVIINRNIYTYFNGIYESHK